MAPTNDIKTVLLQLSHLPMVQLALDTDSAIVNLPTVNGQQNDPKPTSLPGYGYRSLHCRIVRALCGYCLILFVDVTFIWLTASHICTEILMLTLDT